MDGGREFQTRAAACGKARPPTVDLLTGGRSTDEPLADLSLERPGKSETKVTIFDEYLGEAPRRQL